MNRPIWPLAATLVIVSTLIGCVSNPINTYTASRYYDYGFQAERAGDLALARQNFYRAAVNCQMGSLGPAQEASCVYEWSRITGYLGMYADAEKGFNDVLTLIDKAKGKADTLRTPTLCELARLLHDTDQHAKAIPVYEKALAKLEKTTAEKDDPIAFAEFLNDFSGSLRSADSATLADILAQRATAIREQNKGLTANFSARRYKAGLIGSADAASPRP